MIIRGGTVSTPMAGHVVTDDTKVGRSPWSSKGTVDKLCPSFEESGYAVRCEPVEGYPLQVVSNLPESEDGYTDITLQQLGKNLIDFTAYPVKDNWYIRWSTGQQFASTSGMKAIAVAIPISHLRGLTVSLNHPANDFMKGSNGGMAVYDESNKYITGTNLSTITIPQNACYMRLSWDTNYPVEELQLELGDTITDFEPYAGVQEYTAEFGEIVHGGSYDWATGILASTHKRVAMKDLDWYYSEDNAYFFADLPGAGSGAAMCNKEFVHTPGEYSSITSGSGVLDFSFDIYGGGIAVICWDYDDVSDFKAFLDAEAITLLYPLAEPDVMEVATPQTIVGKAGVNTFISGAGTVQVSGKADPVRVIENLTNAIIALGGNI